MAPATATPSASASKSRRMIKVPQTEIERQEKAIAALGAEFEFPLFNGRNAIESQRKSGYKNTARAAREIVDNAYEVGAEHVWALFKRPSEDTRSKGQRRDAVSAIAFIDDGPGMIPEMARYALSWGGGTRFDDPTGIGRFGFGLPNSSINQTRRVEVYSRTSPSDPWQRVVLDITPEKLKNIPASGLVTVDPPESSELPDFVIEFLQKKKIKLEHGTVVVWDKPDRLTARSAAKLRELMLDDFGVVYRNLLDDFKLEVDGTLVKKVDPLFLTPDAMFYAKPEDGGAECNFDRELTVKYYRDPETGAQHLDLLTSVEEVREARKAANVEAIGTISVRISRFPYGFAAETIDGKMVEKESPVYKRLQIRKKRRGMSYIRAGREIETLDNFPTTASDKSNGLGDWPTLQGYALHWGVEVRFTPALDEAFGIGNDKQTVNPIEDFWRVLEAAEVDKAVREEQRFQTQERKKDSRRKAQEEATNTDAPHPASEAASEAEAAMGRSQPLPDDRVQESKEKFEEAVEKEAKEKNIPRDEAEEAVKREAARKKYAIKFFEAEGGVFFKPDFGNGMQRIAMINTAHPFFKSFYSQLASLDDPRPRHAVELLLLALAKAELAAGSNVKKVLEHQRESEWSPFLKLGYGILDELAPNDEEESEEDV